MGILFLFSVFYVGFYWFPKIVIDNFGWVVGLVFLSNFYIGIWVWQDTDTEKNRLTEGSGGSFHQNNATWRSRNAERIQHTEKIGKDLVKEGILTQTEVNLFNSHSMNGARIEYGSAADENIIKYLEDVRSGNIDRYPYDFENGEEKYKTYAASKIHSLKTVPGYIDESQLNVESSIEATSKAVNNKSGLIICYWAFFLVSVYPVIKAAKQKF